MRHTEPTSCRRERGKPTTPNPNTSPTWGCFSRFFTQTGAPSQTRLRTHIPQLCSSLRTSPGGSPGPHVASRTRRGEKKLAKALEKQSPAEGWQQGRAQPLLQPRGTAPEWENKLQDKGKTTGGVVAGFETEQGEAAAGPGGVLGSAQGDRAQGHRAQRCSCPWDPK